MPHTMYVKHHGCGCAAPPTMDVHVAHPSYVINCYIMVAGYVIWSRARSVGLGGWSGRGRGCARAGKKEGAGF